MVWVAHNQPISNESIPRMKTHIWRSTDPLLMVACEEEVKVKLLSDVKRLKGLLGRGV
jgi:hypothetical protein